MNLMHVTQRKQQFSIAYVRAVAASVGYGISNLTEVDEAISDVDQFGRSV